MRHYHVLILYILHVLHVTLHHVLISYFKPMSRDVTADFAALFADKISLPKRIEELREIYRSGAPFPPYSGEKAHRCVCTSREHLFACLESL